MDNIFLNSNSLRLHQLIKKKQTGTPKQLANKLGCSESTVYNRIKELRNMNMPVRYCPILQSYYYEDDVQIDFALKIGGKELKKIVGGQKFLPTADYLECKDGDLKKKTSIRDFLK